ncbi:5-hydroxytryptamine receptor 1A-like [Ostrea edulis]|uniref:5-hydroxytryptamine receptor 1A-like n=1 Tax=Ostrea edulis TaxID=37623 RepID=UPI0024AF4FEA|nr:5-hydroxytryptamine receptor 1A-like [Ostrea edulis]XP_056006503.1 5-hydroxytryptamine receptor 1A-like [Ostrea edulis]
MLRNRTESFNTNCEDSQKKIVTNEAGQIVCIVLLFCVFAVTVIGNIMLIVTVVRRGQFHRKISVFVISLAVADFCVAVLVMVPSIIQYFIVHSLFMDYVRSRLFLALDCMFTTSSILHFTCMNIDRFVAINNPLKYFTIMTGKLVSLLIIICWILSIIISVIVVILNMYNYECDFSLIVQVIPSVIGSGISFYLPLLLNIIASVKICLKVRNRNILLYTEQGTGDKALQRQRHDLEARVTRTIMILQGTFFVCTTPFFVLLLLESLFGLHISNRAWFVVTWLGYSNSTINPYLYCYLNTRTERMDRVCNRTRDLNVEKLDRRRNTGDA